MDYWGGGGGGGQRVCCPPSQIIGGPGPPCPPPLPTPLYQFLCYVFRGSVTLLFQAIQFTFSFDRFDSISDPC